MLRHGMRGMARAARNNVFSGGANQLPRHLSRSLLPVQTRAVGSLVIGSSQPGITIAAPEGDLEVVSPLLMDLWGMDILMLREDERTSFFFFDETKKK